MSIHENTSKLNGLNDEELEKVNGGLVFIDGADEARPYEVINDRNGDVLGRYSSYEDALRAAREEFGVSTDRIFWDQLSVLRSL